MWTSVPRTQLAALALGAAAITGCSDSPTGSSGDALTIAEAEALLRPLVLGFSGGFVGVSPAPEFSAEVNLLLDCAVGGGTEKVGTLHGSTDSVTARVEYRIEFVQSYFHCGYSVPGGSLRISGDPGPRVVVDLVQENTRLAYAFRIRGDVEFETSDRRSGRCAIDLSIGLIYEAPDFQPLFTNRGRACGLAADRIEWVL